MHERLGRAPGHVDFVPFNGSAAALKLSYDAQEELELGDHRLLACRGEGGTGQGLARPGVGRTYPSSVGPSILGITGSLSHLD